MTDVAPVGIITGAARGLGAEVAGQLSGSGWSLVLVDACADDPAIPYALATKDDLDAVVAACQGQAVAHIGDVRDQAALDAAVVLATRQFGGLDAAVAAAGVIAGAPSAWETPDATWAAVLDIDLTGAWRLARAAVPALLARPEPRRGRFVAIASAAGLTGLPQLAAYTAAKHGVIGLVRSMAAELGASGVTANAVCPGSMDTAMLAATAAVYGLADGEEFAVHHPLGRLLEVSEVARLVAWLCSSASGAVTGAALPADAGMTAVAPGTTGFVQAPVPERAALHQPERG